MALRRSCYQLIDIIDFALVIPLAFSALGSGMVIGLATKWRLLRHWWVLVKLVLTVAVIVFSTFGVGVWVEQSIETTTPPSLTASRGRGRGEHRRLRLHDVGFDRQALGQDPLDDQRRDENLDNALANNRANDLDDPTGCPLTLVGLDRPARPSRGRQDVVHLCVFGASGPIGRAVLTQALREDHAVTAVTAAPTRSASRHPGCASSKVTSPTGPR